MNRILFKGYKRKLLEHSNNVVLWMFSLTVKECSMNITNLYNFKKKHKWKLWECTLLAEKLLVKNTKNK